MLAGAATARKRCCRKTRREPSSSASSSTAAPSSGPSWITTWSSPTCTALAGPRRTGPAIGSPSTSVPWAEPVSVSSTNPGAQRRAACRRLTADPDSRTSLSGERPIVTVPDSGSATIRPASGPATTRSSRVPAGAPRAATGCAVTVTVTVPPARTAPGSPHSDASGPYTVASRTSPAMPNRAASARSRSATRAPGATSRYTSCPEPESMTVTGTRTTHRLPLACWRICRTVSGRGNHPPGTLRRPSDAYQPGSGLRVQRRQG